MTKAEKMGKKFCGQYEQYEGSIVNPRGCFTKIPEDDIVDFIQQVGERTLEEVLLLGWEDQDDEKIRSCRWWEEEA